MLNLLGYIMMFAVSHAAPHPGDFTLPKPLPSLQKKAKTEIAQEFRLLEEEPALPAPKAPGKKLQKISTQAEQKIQFSREDDTPFIFDIPVTYNRNVQKWIRYFQTSGRVGFRTWLERAPRYIPMIQFELAKAGLPQDLVYIAMIESGFSNTAVSHASAMGLWQFIEGTGSRYGMSTSWWLDERRDFYKATKGAVSYLGDLYRMFRSWYLVAASYNMGENGVRRLIDRHKTNDFWKLAEKRVLPLETTDYVPKILAAMLIAKAPALYGFRDLNPALPYSFDYAPAPGGTDLHNLAKFLGVETSYLRELNPELLKGFIPRHVAQHRIRVPKGSVLMVKHFSDQLLAR